MLKTIDTDTDITASPPPGALARIVGMQAEWYARHWGFGRIFEAKVASEVGEYGLAQPHADCRTWVALDDQGVVGTVTIDGRGRPAARLRWFFVEERARGGLGRRLLDHAIDFCRDAAFREVWLTTFEGLYTARALYNRFGFEVAEEGYDTTWGVEVREQLLRLRL